MIERLAQAIANELARQEGIQDAFAMQDGKLSYLDQGEVDMFAVARVAIGAMREPTEAMVESGVAASAEEYGSIATSFPISGERVRAIWQAMIDAEK